MSPQWACRGRAAALCSGVVQPALRQVVQPAALAFRGISCPRFSVLIAETTWCKSSGYFKLVFTLYLCVVFAKNIKIWGRARPSALIGSRFLFGVCYFSMNIFWMMFNPNAGGRGGGVSFMSISIMQCILYAAGSPLANIKPFSCACVL